MGYMDYLKASDRNAIRDRILENFETPTVSKSIVNKEDKENRHTKNVLNETAEWLDKSVYGAIQEKNDNIAHNENLKTALLTECFYKIYEESKDTSVYEYDDNLAKTYISRYISENGASSILNKMKSSSVLLSELAYYVEKACNSSKCKEETEDEYDAIKARDEYIKKYDITPENKDKFFEDLDNSEDVKDVAQSIQLRVSSAMSEFINDNTRKKNEIDNTIEDIKSKITADTTEDMKESLQMRATRRINAIKESGDMNLFGKLVNELCTSIYKNNDLKKSFCEDNKINMTKVIAHVKTLYTVLEVFNTTKVANFGVKGIQEIVESYKM